MFRTPNIAADIGTVIIGFSIYDMIYAEWSQRVAFLGLSGDDFGFIKGLFIALVCVPIGLLCFMAAIDSYVSRYSIDEDTQVFEVKHDEGLVERLDIDPDQMALSSFIILVIVTAAVFYAFGVKTAFSLGLGLLVYTLQPYLDRLGSHFASK